MTTRERMVYLSTVSGVTDTETNAPTVYFGRVYKVPFAVLGTPEHKEAEANQLAEIEKLITEGTDRLPEVAFPKGGVVERYEVFDVESGDVFVMWRIPMQDKQDNVTPKPNPKRRGGYVN